MRRRRWVGPVGQTRVILNFHTDTEALIKQSALPRFVRAAAARAYMLQAARTHTHARPRARAHAPTHAGTHARVQYRFLASAAHGAYTVSAQTQAVLQSHGIKTDGLCAALPCGLAHALWPGRRTVAPRTVAPHALAHALAHGAHAPTHSHRHTRAHTVARDAVAGTRPSHSSRESG